MSHEQLELLKRWVSRVWLFSPERLWLVSIALHRRGHWVLAFWIKQLNTLLYSNSLAPGASVSPDILLGHNSIGIVVSSSVTIGRRVKIWQNVTLSAGRPARTPANGTQTAPLPIARIVVEDGVKIGANAVIIAPRGRTLRIGRGARVGAGTVVTEDVPAGATVVGAPSRLLASEPTAQNPDKQLHGVPDEGEP
jgi:serine O-acetyltransferase